MKTDAKFVGKPKSGKNWKKGSTPARDLDTVAKKDLPNQSFESRMKAKKVRQEAKELENQMIASVKEAKEKARKKLEAKKKRQEGVTEGQFQMVKKKLGKLRPKMREQLVKMPTDMFYQLVHGRKLA
mmetsp:Transcript_18529/g.33457  ORF Transcript_18529/g.33457 Transcript_18529/m.33457 type:complete len:127 (+) Transcript_18529:1691-2071(+)